MNPTMSDPWQSVWEQHVPKQTHSSTLQRLMEADGYGRGFGAIAEQHWRKLSQFAAEKCGIKPGDTVFEVGCGAGAFLYPFWKSGHEVAGIDYSNSLVNIARNALPGASITVGRADALPSLKQYDIVLSNGVFIYFPTLHYASSVLKQMLALAVKGVAILDVADKAKEQQAIVARQAYIGKEDYERKYSGLNHLYYPKEWFQRFADSGHWRCEVLDQNVPDYYHTPFRFNAFFTRPSAT